MILIYLWGVIERAYRERQDGEKSCLRYRFGELSRFDVRGGLRLQLRSRFGRRGGDRLRLRRRLFPSLSKLLRRFGGQLLSKISDFMEKFTIFLWVSIESGA